MYHKVFYLKFTLKYNFALLGNVAHERSPVSHRIIIQKKDQLYKNSLKFIKIPLMQLALLLTVSKIELVNPFRITILVQCGIENSGINVVRFQFSFTVK